MCGITAPSPMGLSRLNDGVEEVWHALPYPALLRFGPGARKIFPWTEPKEGVSLIFRKELSLSDLSQS